MSKQVKRGTRDAYADLLPTIADLKANGAASLHQIASGLNSRGIRTAKGGEWSAVQVQRILNAA